ncbi:MAG: hypothetical protein GOV01_00575 [Candidatus Altiarchaeota archaeon]|nr:hypothetical protein [Candidatus Altiarchaeota archaeon]
MSTQTGDMEELAIALIILVVKISIAVYFGAYVLASLSQAAKYATGFNMVSSFSGGAISGITGGIFGW